MPVIRRVRAGSAAAYMTCAVGLLASVPSAARAQAVETLIEQLGSPSATERATAACWLGRMSAEDVRRARDELLELLVDGTEVEGPLCRDVRSRRRDDRSYESSPGREAAIALEELGVEAIDPLTTRLAGNDRVARENAALALGLIESSESVGVLGAAATGDAVARVRARAAWALGMIEDAEGVRPLAEALEDPDADVRREAAWALGMIESPLAVSALGLAIVDEDPRVRAEAAWALGMIESRAAVALLTPALLGDPAPEVRREAAWALGMIEDPAAAESLLQALEDDVAAVREEAMWALGMVLRRSSFNDIDRAELAEAVRRALRREL